MPWSSACERSVGTSGWRNLANRNFTVETTSIGVSAEAIRTQLDRILASPGFIHSDRMARFLRFTVDQVLKGHATELKETVLGMEVFDRSSSFDPRTDTIVRVEARRLRS